MILERIKHREHTHIQGVEGSGKTHLLNSLPGTYVEPRPLKPIIQALAGQTKGSMSELKQKIDYNQVLLIDDVQDMTKQIKRFIEKAMRQGLIIVTAGTKNTFKLHEVKLKPLSFEASVKLVNKHLRNKELARVIASEVGGNPGLLMQAVRRAKVHDTKTLNGFKGFKQSINSLIKRKELFNYGLLIMIYPIVQTLRYFFYSQRNYKMGSYLAMSAYILMLLKNIAKKR